jgi:bifunctional UDP-N-acetylglucosamine pyrophosphorylase/glucosamine-1-phosphate N-acetyltransferase
MKYELKREKSMAQNKSTYIHQSAMLKGNVSIGKNVKIMEYAKINGPCYLGDNSVVGSYALITESHIGKDSLIGGYTEVTRSYIGEGVMLHRNYIGDSILMNDVFCGAGAVTANMRLDKKTVKSVIKEKRIDSQKDKLGAMIGRDAKIGVNASLMPGVKIGSGKAVLPGKVVYKDIT